ncbi:MAG: decarboxylating 6-phosphogluconate dehydrogenase [Candidatus Paceibacterota bacterium]
MERFEKGSTIGYVGLGKMGLNMVTLMKENEYNVVAYDRSQESRKEAEELGVEPRDSIQGLIESLEAPRTIWIMVPHQAVGDVLEDLCGHLDEGDTVIDGGNSHYTESVERAKRCREQGIHFVDIGVSGGPGGALNGACMMVGGGRGQFDRLEPLINILCVEGGYGYMGEAGAGHFAKMVHNGIEYGMMQAIAEGFEIMKKSEFGFDLAEVARVYSKGSVIESRLIDWARDAYQEWGNELEGISGSAKASGEADWTVQAAEELGVKRNVIADALEARYASQEEPNYQGQVIMALRNKFGGHEAGRSETK